MNVFESPIDLMSYLTLLKLYKVTDFNNHCISLGCIADIALERYLEEHKSINRIIACLDNDKAGSFGTERIKEKYLGRYLVSRHFPKEKDFNEDLLNLVNNIEISKQRNKDTEKIDEVQENVISRKVNRWSF